MKRFAEERQQEKTAFSLMLHSLVNNMNKMYVVLTCFDSCNINFSGFLISNLPKSNNYNLKCSMDL